MSLARTLLVIAATTACLAAGAAPASAWDFQLGMGDQQSRMFDDPRFERLGFEHARVVAPYDVVCRPDAEQQYYLDTWLAKARRAEVRPLVAFSFSLREGARWKLPSYRRFMSCFRAFRKRYPQVRDFNPWNEANHSSQPTYRHPKKAAGFYNAMRRACPRCNVAAGDLLDWSNLPRWLERYRPHLRGRVRLWSLHNYLDVNRKRSWQRSDARLMLSLTRGHLWITETAGVVHSGRYSRYSEQRAAAATERHLQVRLGLARGSRASTPTTGRRPAAPTAGTRPGFAPTARRDRPTACWSSKISRQWGLGRAATAALDPPVGPAMYDACADERQQREQDDLAAPDLDLDLLPSD